MVRKRGENKFLVVINVQLPSTFNLNSASHSPLDINITRSASHPLRRSIPVISHCNQPPLQSNTCSCEKRNTGKMKWSTEYLGNGYKSIFNLQNGKKSRKTVSRSINNDQVPRDGEYATAVLAATFAIHSLEEAKRTPQNKNERRKEGNRNGLEPHSNEVTKRASYNNAKTTAEASMRKPKLQDHGAVETSYPARTPSRSSSFRSTPVADARERVEKHEKLKSVLAWANEKKMKAKKKIERTKSELEMKITKKPATLPKQGRYYL